eukprot:11179721-Lingulodinium_polyedra.AAC.1
MEHGTRATPATRPIVGPKREVTLPDTFENTCRRISQTTLITIPKISDTVFKGMGRDARRSGARGPGVDTVREAQGQ